jgi:hypothetical protein
MLKRGLLLLLLAASTAVAQAQYGTQSTPQTRSPQNSLKNGCPWLTQGTVAWALGGDVSAAINVSTSAEGSCKFSRLQGPPDSVEIVVSKVALPTCPAAGIELKGIGNQAVRCNCPGSHGEDVEMISSRVRDLYFTVTLASRGQKSAGKPDEQDDALEQISEEVAGSLY